jgi:hypothetical protein
MYVYVPTDTTVALPLCHIAATSLLQLSSAMNTKLWILCTHVCSVTVSFATIIQSYLFTC